MPGGGGFLLLALPRSDRCPAFVSGNVKQGTGNRELGIAGAETARGWAILVAPPGIPHSLFPVPCSLFHISPNAARASLRQDGHAARAVVGANRRGREGPWLALL